ncbi:hypothetical protein PENARI_c095G04295 [Penicillium arizonense]|uniref:FAR1 domain-containing protein n=1 Tax=Penicillium arizonense TaxID=1835702 RepID=A0A1F5L1P5_PENAI|nr:hypothetical protein PENARI_c095G04295 [Penicillium arizonense]OGE46879.1 hypothetical protein PENARI_c095G04295 [Penicillium arizonense]
MASSQPDSPSDSEPEAIPESPPALPSLHNAPPSLQNTAPSLYILPLPPLDTHYDTPEQGISAINAFGRAHGYAVAILRSKITKRGVKKTVRLCCDRSRRVRPDDGPDGPTRKRQTTSLAIECPFLISLRLQEGRWNLTVENQHHNHEPSPPLTHAPHRMKELNTKASNIEKQLEQGLSTRHILTSIRKDDQDSCLIARDIYNFRRKLHMEFLAGRTPL